jgi:hypothetical protein
VFNANFGQGMIKTHKLVGKGLVTLLFFASSYFAQANVSQIKCTRSDLPAGGSSTFFLETEGVVRTLTGNVTYPNGKAVPFAAIEIYRLGQKPVPDQFSYGDVEQIVKDKSLPICRANSNGRFKVTGLEDGNYLLVVGVPSEGSSGGFGPEHILIEVSHKKGRKRKLEVSLGTAI